MTTPIANTPRPEMRQKYRLLNYVLIAVLVLLTCKKTLAVIMVGSLHPYNLAGLVVPVINVFFIRLLLLYQKSGYQFLCILSVLALLYPENRQPIESTLYILMIVMSAHLYLKMFPKEISSGSKVK